MSLSVKYFMWPYQLHFQAISQIEIQQLLRRLHVQSESRVFMVGFLDKESGKGHPICIVPDEFEISPSSFVTVPDNAANLGKYNPSHHSFYTLKKLQDKMVQGILESGWRQAVFECIEYHCHDKWISFVSSSVKLEGYRVFTVVQISRKAIEQYYSLTKSSISGKSTASFSIHRYLIESVVSIYLDECVKHLTKPNPGDSFRIVDDLDEVIRAAGKRMMDAPALAGGNFSGIHGHFEICNEISRLLYEGGECSGSILYIDRKHPSLLTEFLLRREVSIRDHGAVRKLLEITTKDLALLCDSDKVYGLGSLSSDYDISREDAFTVWFSRRFSWQLRHGSNVLMHVTYGMPDLETARFPSTVLHDHLQRVFPGITDLQATKIVRLAECVGRQNHGKMLVIVSDADGEAKRLKQQCTPVLPFELTEAQVPMVTAIDGSVVIDIHCACHAIGVILDGLSHDKCSAARGSRYNSAVRYVYSSSGRLAVVKSEDGMIDIMPCLMPRIPREELEGSMRRIKEMGQQSGYVDRTEFYQIMDWFDTHRFYLPGSMCDELNSLWPKVQDKCDQQEFRLLYNRFEPDPELNDSYFV